MPEQVDLAELNIAVRHQQVQQADASLDRLQKTADRTEREIKDLREGMEGVDRTSQRVGVSWGRLVRLVGPLIGGLTALTALTRSIQLTSSFEQGLVSVGKTTDIVGPQLERLGDEIIYLSTVIPVGTAQLLEIGKAAGQLGVTGPENILKFTDTVAKLGTAANISGEEAATALARILNVTRENINTVDTLASVIVRLGNNVAAQESEITRHAQYVAQATAVYDIGSVRAAGYAATLAELGVRAELSGSSVGRAFRAIDAAIREGDQSLDLLAQLTGIGKGDVQRQFREDPTQVFLAFLRGLDAVVKQGGSAAEVLERFGLSGEEVLKVIPTLAVANERLARNLRLAADESKNATALEQEAARAFDTLGSAYDLLRNRIAAGILTVREYNGAMKDIVLVFADAVAILFDLEVAQGRATAAAQNLALGLRLISDAAIAVGILSIAKAVRALTLAIARNPLGLLAVGVSFLIVELARFAFSLRGSTTELERMEAAVKSLSDEIARMEGLSGVVNRAFSLGDPQEIADALTQVREVLKQQSAQFQQDAGQLTLNLDEVLKLLPERIKQLAPGAIQQVQEAAVQARNETIAALRRALDQRALQNQTGRFQLTVPQNIRDIEEKIQALQELPLTITGREAALFLENTIKLLDQSIAGYRELFEGTQAAPLNIGEIVLPPEQDIAKVRDATKDLVKELQDQRAVIGLSARDAELYRATVQALAITEGLAADERRENLRTIIELTEQIFDETAVQTIRDTIESMKTENEIRRLQIAGLEEEAEVKRVLNDLDLRGVDVSDELLVQLRQQVRERQELAKATTDQNDAILSYIRSLELEASLIGKTSEERERATRLAEVEQQLRTLSIAQLEEVNRVLQQGVSLPELPEEKAKLITQALDLIQGKLKDLKEAQELDQFFQSAGDSVGDFVGDVIFEFDKLSDVIEGFFRSLSRQFFDFFVSRQISQLVASSLAGAFAPSAMGNVFDNGRIVPFAQGGIINGPMLFGLRGGLGLAGEAGPEAVVPLARTPSGDLGIKSSGVGGPRVVVQGPLVAVYANNPDEFGASQRQLIEAGHAALSRLGG